MNTPGLACKAARDPYYAAMVSAGADQSALLNAGFFDDLLERRARDYPWWDTSMLTTPLAKVRRNLAAAKPGTRKLVLLCTGAFSPVHMGHLALMEQAREHAQVRGFEVVAGYLSPSHDAYVDVKAGGTAAMHAESRIALAEEAVHDSDWLAVCAWEARHAPVALNFTDVVERLRGYLAAHVGHIEVAYVFGSDNLFFLDAFRETGLAFCGVRGEMSATAAAAARWLVNGREQRLHLVPPPYETGCANASSTGVRGGNLSVVPERARARLVALKTGTPATGVYLLREDLAFASADWSVGPAALSMFHARLRSLLEMALDGAASVVGLPLEAQAQLAGGLTVGNQAVLSLDACIPGDAQLQTSRQFDLGGSQVASVRRGERPGAPPLDQQLSLLDAKRAWLVVDDDKATGGTEVAVREMLQSKGLGVVGFRYLNEAYLAGTEHAGAQVLDVVDARDFLLGAKDSGLVVEMPTGELARAPYMLPFVNLVFRAKIPPPACRELSCRLWELNADWFAEHAYSLTIGDAAGPAAVLLRYLGFRDSTRLEDCCRALSRWSGYAPRGADREEGRVPGP